jgi:hypothetical protein
MSVHSIRQKDRPLRIGLGQGPACRCGSGRASTHRQLPITGYAQPMRFAEPVPGTCAAGSGPPGTRTYGTCSNRSAVESPFGVIPLGRTWLV